MATELQNPPAKRFGLPNILLIIALGALLYGEVWCGYHFHALAARQEKIKQDYSTINSITFGLFSIDQWRDKMSEVIDKQVNGFSISPEQKKAMQAQIEQQLHGMVSKAFAGINKPQKTFFGRVKKIAVNKFVDTVQVYAQVPSFAKTIVDKISSPASTDRLKSIANITINKLEQQTYDSSEVASKAVTSYMYGKYHAADALQLERQVNGQLLAIHTLSYKYMYAMFGCVLAALLLWLAVRSQVHLHTTLFVMSLLFAAVLLAVGITSSIVEVDAQLKAFDFMLMGEDVSFKHQDLFFQSKSILEIVETLINQPKPDAVVVGVLLMLFVIILPVIRIIARGIHILSAKKIANSKAIRYMAFDAAKWDMADVMVVGILMTYIGLNGILKSQLSDLEMHGSALNVTTLNNTSLQPGYFVFVGYVVFTIILASILKRITPHK